MKNFSIRRASYEDIERIFEIESSSLALWKKEYFYNELDYDFSIMAVAEDIDGQIAGFAVFWKITGEIQLQNIAVDSRYRRLGAASSLLKWAVQQCADIRPEKILLEVSNLNRGALAFYERLGFIKTGLRPKYYGDSDAVLMEKVINEV